ncbi:MAG: tRNA 4-thiouridine(8) synthase ThiI [Candidatus Omnitrophica bacterium]|nr:tRNA 4-thiouridine(8) synthase ThiI [Candidatus Omnitrophota bacterium]
MKIKAIGLVSGGLDSMIATKLMLDLGIDVNLVIFSSPFFHGKLVGKESIDFMGLKATVIELKDDYFDIIKNPEYGYGSGANPCIDCKIYMFKEAAKIMEQKKASFIFTGEVLNQRPFSQTKNFMQLIEKKAGLKGRILRPLSAKLLEPTIPEIEGIVDREKLLGISGRQRKQQLALAESLGIVGFSQPAGGCLLTDPIYAKKLKELFSKRPDSTINDAELIKHGRVFWHNDVIIVIGRNKDENKILSMLAKKDDFIIYPKNVPGPFCVVRGKKIENESLDYAKRQLLFYTNKGPPQFKVKRVGKKNEQKQKNMGEQE